MHSSVSPSSQFNDLPVSWRSLQTGHPWIERFSIDAFPQSIGLNDYFNIGGILVLSRNAPEGLTLMLEGPGGAQELSWGLDSPRMRKEYPKGKNAGKARWEGCCQFPDESYAIVVVLRGLNEEPLTIGEMLLTEPAAAMKHVYRENEDRLIFDIGANDGADSRYYLRKGFRVVAVEAIPDLAESLRASLSTQISAGRLTVVQKAVTSLAGTVTMTINEDWTEWSSAHEASKAFSGQHRKISVPTAKLSSFIAESGRPYYIKIDIEGGELDAVRSLHGLPADMLPEYISVEANQRIFDVLKVLWELGYREFQSVRQGADFLPPPPYPSLEGLDYRCLFSNNMSGTFGLDLPPQGWVSLGETIRRVLAFKEEMKERTRLGNNPGWYDIHARFVRH